MDNLKKLVSIRTDSSCDKCIEYISSFLKEKVKEIKVIKSKENGCNALLVGINTYLQDIEPIVLSGHIDTVPANKQLYSTDPYTLTEKNGKMYGLGSIDMKSFIAVIMDNIDKLCMVSKPIIMALTTDEETNLYSVNAIIEEFKRLNIKPVFTVIGEPTDMDFCTTANACYEYEVFFEGLSCHSCNPSLGVNAIYACAKLISYIEDKQKQYRLTSNCGLVSGGEAINIVPDRASVRFDIRGCYEEDIQEFLADIQSKIKSLEAEYKGLVCRKIQTLNIPSLNVQDSPYVQKLSEKLKVKTKAFTAGCEAGYFYQYSGLAVIFGVGQLSLAHKPNEYVVIDEYYKYSKLLLDLINELAIML